MSEWIKTSDRMPGISLDCLVYRKWAGQEEFSIELERWEKDDSFEGGGYWCAEDSHVEWVECVANGPGYCERPVTSHWMPSPLPPAEGE